MKDVIEYKNFIGSVHFDSEDSVFYGKILGVSDLVTFEGQTVEELKSSFKEAVEDYVVLCRQTGKAVLKSCKGSFNVRISSDLQRQAIQKAALRGISLNQFVQKAIEQELTRN